MGSSQPSTGIVKCGPSCNPSARLAAHPLVRPPSRVLTHLRACSALRSNATFTSDHTPKPSSRMEALAMDVAAAVADCAG